MDHELKYFVNGKLAKGSRILEQIENDYGMSLSYLILEPNQLKDLPLFARLPPKVYILNINTCTYVCTKENVPEDKARKYYRYE